MAEIRLIDYKWWDHPERTGSCFMYSLAGLGGADEEAIQTVRSELLPVAAKWNKTWRKWLKEDRLSHPDTSFSKALCRVYLTDLGWTTEDLEIKDGDLDLTGKTGIVLVQYQYSMSGHAFAVRDGVIISDGDPLWFGDYSDAEIWIPGVKKV